MATASFRLTVDGKHEADVLHALVIDLHSTRTLPGCVSCHVERDVDVRGSLRFHSRWDSEDHLRSFLRSDILTRVLQLLELGLEAPEVLICWGHEDAGLRSLREVRNAGSEAADGRTTGCGCESTLLSFAKPGSDSLPDNQPGNTNRDKEREMKQSTRPIRGIRKAVGVILMAGMLAVAGMPTVTSAQEAEEMFDVETADELAPAADGRVIRFVELEGASLADANLPEGKERAHRRMLAEEKADFRSEATSRGIDFVERHGYEVLFNGLSIDIAVEDLPALEAMDGVVATYPVYRVHGGGTPVAASAPEGTTRENVTVSDLTHVPQAHAAGYTGEGVVVGVIDGGIDYTHRALGGTGFPNDKVIGGWDFADNDADPFDDRSGAVYNHGTHVSGIVAGNDEIMVGVAPDAKIRFYRVFGTTNPGGTEDILMAAMERAADDGCDVVNMSWGTNRIDVLQNGVMARAADNLVKRDVVAVSAIGNAGTAGPFLPGSPAIGKQVIAVAAAYNNDIAELAFELNEGSDVAFRPMYVGPPVPGSGTWPITDFGTADCQPIADDVSYEGQVVMVQRGSYSCRTYTQVNLLAQAGAEAVIWWQYSSYDPTRWPSQFSSQTTQLEIPTVVVRQFDAETIAAQGAAATLTWGHYVDSPTNYPGVTTFFSTWGPTYELDMKPDVMAPGGYVFSTLPIHYGGYGLMDGTSMASPHVAGVAALVRAANPRLKAHEVREILMSTANPTPFNADPTMGLHPIAQQGSGLVDAMAAISTAAKADPAKLSLGDLNGLSKTETIKIENRTDVDLTYNVSHVPALTAMPPFTSRWVPSTQTATVTYEPETLLVPAGGEAELTVTFHEPSAVAGGSILSGWIELTTVGGAHSQRIPYVALKGDYHELPALNPTWSDINPNIGNPSLRPESRPYCEAPPWSRPQCCNDPTPGSCYFDARSGFNEPQTLDFTNDDKYDDMVFALVSQGFPMLRKYRARVLDETGKTVAWAVDSHSGGIRGGASLELLEYWVRNDGAGTGIDLAEWHGTLEDGSPAPAGTYYIRLEFDKFDGDGASYPDFEDWTSPPITLIR
ncbi:MAG: S8 family serine peptidase [Gemmatimonadota bacterium]